MGSTTEVALIGRWTWTRAINHLNNSTENCERVKIATKICSSCRLPNKFANLMLALSNHFRLGCFDPHLTLFASCYFGRKVPHHRSRASRSQLLEKICAAVAIYPRFWWESGSTFLDSTHSTRIISGGRFVQNWSILFYQILQRGLQNSFWTSGRHQLKCLILLNPQVLDMQDKYH